MLLSEKAEWLKNRYIKSFAREDQVYRAYDPLGIITYDEYQEILASKQLQEETEGEPESNLS